MKYWLTGGSGVLGTELQKHLDCWAPNTKTIDLTWGKEYIFRKLQNYTEHHSIDTIIHAAAYTDVPGAERERRKTIDINVNGTKTISDIAKYLRKKIVYISTDYVYDGRKGNYRETDEPRPINFYAMTKYMGEAYTSDGDLVIRTSFKPNTPWPYENSFHDLYTSADYVDVIAPMIVNIIKAGVMGIYNIGTKRKSIYELALQRNPRVKPISKNSIKNVYLPDDVSMNMKKYHVANINRTKFV